MYEEAITQGLSPEEARALANNAYETVSSGLEFIYTAYDSYNTATHSKTIINKVIRKKINFRGIIISDDISMKALKYGLKNNAVKALDAGCNLIMHCNGNFKEMLELVKVVPRIDAFTQKKTSDFYKFLG